MRFLIRSFVFLAICFLGEGTILSSGHRYQEIPNEIMSALATGNAKEVSKHFHSSIQLILLDREGMYSREQAEQILRNFFSQHQPTHFTVRHEGGTSSKDSRFIIGILQTGKGIYRISLFMKIIDGKLSIHQLRIEEDNV